MKQMKKVQKNKQKKKKKVNDDNSKVGAASFAVLLTVRQGNIDA